VFLTPRNSHAVSRPISFSVHPIQPNTIDAMSSSTNKHVNVERRTWDKETYEARARSRATADANDAASSHRKLPNASTTSSNPALEQEEQEKEEFLPAQQGRAGPMGSQRAFLKSRSRKVDLESKLGTTEIIDPNAAATTKSRLSSDKINDGVVAGPSNGVTKCSDGVGWHCKVCDCFLKDSLTYLDHINGKKHQRYLGYSMRVEKSTVDEVSGVLKGLAEKKREEGNETGIGALLGSNAGGGRGGNNGIGKDVIDFEQVVKAKDEEALRRKAERARRREERKKREKQESVESGVYYVEEVREEEADEGNGANIEGKQANPAVNEGEQQQEEEEDEEVDESGIDPNLAAMMGFSGFGGKKK